MQRYPPLTFRDADLTRRPDHERIGNGCSLRPSLEPPSTDRRTICCLRRGAIGSVDLKVSRAAVVVRCRWQNQAAPPTLEPRGPVDLGRRYARFQPGKPVLLDVRDIRPNSMRNDERPGSLGQPFRDAMEEVEVHPLDATCDLHPSRPMRHPQL